MLNKTGIYKIISPINKVYIGQALSIYKRWNYGYKNLQCQNQPKIYDSLKKYGWEQHKFEIIEECYPSRLDQREVFHKKQFIKKYGWENALFTKVKDKKGGKQSKETRDKRSKILMGHEVSEETRNKISLKNLGKIRNKEHRINYSKAKKGVPKPKDFGKQIAIILKGKERTEEFKNKIRNNKERGKKISISLKGHKQSKESNKKRSIALKGKKHSKERILKRYIPIFQYDLNNNFLKKWASQTEIKQQLGLIICECLSGRAKTAGRYIWRYKN